MPERNASATASSSRPRAVTERGSWQNWAGNQTLADVAIARPRDVEELAAVVGHAARTGSRVRPIGSGHSWTGLGATDGVQIQLDRLARIVSADRASGLVMVEAGMPLHRLNATLEQIGLALPNLGDIDRQTLAGAVSTATHGTGARFGGLATQIVGLQIVLADGSLVSCNATERPDLFSAARVSLGALGVIATITLQCVPAFHLHALETPLPYEQVVEELDDLVADNEHFEFFWYPHTGRMLTKRNNRLDPDEEPQPLTAGRSWVGDRLFMNTVRGLTFKLGGVVPQLIPQINEQVSSQIGHRDYSDVSHKVFCSTRKIRFMEMEYGLPVDAARTALAGIRSITEQEDMNISFPIEMRFTAADDIPLSTSYGRDSVYLAVHVVNGDPYVPYFRAVEALLTDLGGRPHWGKMHTQTRASLEPRYPQFGEFLAQRDAVDPEGRFANPHLDDLLGAVRG